MKHFLRAIMGWFFEETVVPENKIFLKRFSLPLFLCVISGVYKKMTKCISSPFNRAVTGMIRLLHIPANYNFTAPANRAALVKQEGGFFAAAFNFRDNYTWDEGCAQSCQASFSFHSFEMLSHRCNNSNPHFACSL
jgi:hypothetical protein